MRTPLNDHVHVRRITSSHDSLLTRARREKQPSHFPPTYPTGSYLLLARVDDCHALITHKESIQDTTNSKKGCMTSCSSVLYRRSTIPGTEFEAFFKVARNDTTAEQKRKALQDNCLFLHKIKREYVPKSDCFYRKQLTVMNCDPEHNFGRSVRASTTLIHSSLFAITLHSTTT